MPGKFLSAEWRKLVIFNFEADPVQLRKYLPAHTELDDYNGKYFLSLVGFHFLNTKVLGIKWPLHTNFLEVNLRFYVKRYVNGEWRRGVVFIRELVTKRIITFVANNMFKENYRSVALSTDIKEGIEDITVKYAVVKNGHHIFGAQAQTQAWGFKPGSIEDYITEHYYGYSKINDNKTVEYGVEHPQWSCYPVKNYFLKMDFKALYGEEFSFLTGKKPSSVLLAEGSEIIVKRPLTLK